MSEEDRPRKPHPDSVWDEQQQVWRSPDDRSEAQRAADEEAAKLGDSGKWEQRGFRRKHTARVDKT